MSVDSESDQYYENMFSDLGGWSGSYPNTDESLRWSKIVVFLSEIKQRYESNSPKQLSILDLGCGRGWIANLARTFGRCDAIDPVLSVVEYGKTLYPSVNFMHGSVESLLGRDKIPQYDVIICSEVIEHIPDDDKSRFLSQISLLLRPRGYLILTTPRGELFEAWKRLGYPEQPIEQWITENALFEMVRKCGYEVIKQDRVYQDRPGMTIINRLCSSKKVILATQKIGLRWLFEGLKYYCSIYQVWLLQFSGAREQLIK